MVELLALEPPALEPPPSSVCYPSSLIKSRELGGQNISNPNDILGGKRGSGQTDGQAAHQDDAKVDGVHAQLLYGGQEPGFSKLFADSFPALLCPIIILGGIYTGWLPGQSRRWRRRTGR